MKKLAMAFVEGILGRENPRYPPIRRNHDRAQDVSGINTSNTPRDSGGFEKIIQNKSSKVMMPSSRSERNTDVSQK